MSNGSLLFLVRHRITDLIQMLKWGHSDWAVVLEQRAAKRDELPRSLWRNWVITAARRPGGPEDAARGFAVQGSWKTAVDCSDTEYMVLDQADKWKNVNYAFCFSFVSFSRWRTTPSFRHWKGFVTFFMHVHLRNSCSCPFTDLAFFESFSTSIIYGLLTYMAF